MDTQRPLTRRQREVLDLWLADVPYKQLAAQLGLSPETINPHLKAIAKKLGATGISRTALRNASNRNSEAPPLEEHNLPQPDGSVVTVLAPS